MVSQARQKTFKEVQRQCMLILKDKFHFYPLGNEYRKFGREVFWIDSYDKSKIG